MSNAPTTPITTIDPDTMRRPRREQREPRDEAGVPHAVHLGVGEMATLIAESAQRLRCDHIVMSTARKNSLARMLEDCVANEDRSS
ncbi:MAG: universal stress protein [Gammaproteobacteria bacterium]